MLNTIEEREVHTGGALESANFSIKANGKAFKVLIDGLYADKILAVIRELCTNAYDSHAEAGCKDRAFDVHVPTTWEPYFSVRDYGVSLSHDAVMRLYTCVFESTKENTNEQVGKLGLGSKSPFAYTDTFTVTAWRNGQKRIYSAIIGRDYIPRISLLAEADSDEPQGLEVSFPVKMEDAGTFRTKIGTVMRGFDPLPNAPGIEYDPPKAIFEGTGWKLFDGYRASAEAKQGCVLYPIAPDAVKGATYEQVALLRGAFQIDFPIGELEITASREGLGYDTPTCANILARLAVIEAELLAQISDKIKAAPTLWEARKLAKLLKSQSIPSCAHALLKGLKWRGKTLPDVLDLHITPRERMTITVDTALRGWFSSGRGRKTYMSTNNTHLRLDPENTTFVWYDTSRPMPRYEERLRFWRDAAAAADTAVRYHQIVVLKGRPDSPGLRRLLVKFGRPVCHVLNDVVLPPRQSTTASRSRVQAKLLNGAEPRRAARVDIDVSDDSDEPIYYVMSERNCINYGNKEYSFYGVHEIFKALKAAGVIDANATGYIVPQSIKHIVKGARFVNVMALAAATVKTRFRAHEVEAFLVDAAKLEIKSTWWERFVEQMLDHPPLPGTSPLGRHLSRLHRRLRDVVEARKRLAPLIDMASRLGVWHDYSASTRRRAASAGPRLPDALAARYPLLAVIKASASAYEINDALVKSIVEYVNLVDNSAGHAVKV